MSDGNVPATAPKRNILDLIFEEMPIRIIDQDGKPWFVLKDLGRALEIINVSDMAGRLEDDEKDGVDLADPHGRVQFTTIVNEGGFYRLVSRSGKPVARRLQRWVFNDVLPSIRKTGSYGVKPVIDVRDQGQLAQIAAQLIELNRELSLKNEEMKPKALFHDAVSASSDDMDMEQVAKVLGTGRNRMFKWLREIGILKSDNLPYQRHVDAGHFVVVQKQRFDHNGESKLYTQTRVTGKGLAYIQKKWSEASGKN